MKAIVFHQTGGPEVLRYEDAPDPRPESGEVVVRVRAAALNRIDIWIRAGAYPTPLPHILGSDGAGVVESVGPDVEWPRPGDKVVISPWLSDGTCPYCAAGEDNQCEQRKILGNQVDGTFAERVKIPARNAFPYPGEIPFSEAAAVTLTASTAWHMLISRAQLRAGETVLIQGASSGLGTAAIQIAHLAGARVLAATSSNEKAARARELGADEAINYTEKDLADEALRLTGGRGVDLVFEHVGAATWDASVRSLARCGRLVTAGATTGAKVEFDVRTLYSRQLSFIGSMGASRTDVAAVLEQVARRRLRPVISRVMPLAEAAAAERLLEERKFFGKIVLET